MEKIKVSKPALLALLHKNRAAHRAIFEKAWEGYRKKAIALLDDRLTKLKEGRHVTVVVHLTMPTDQTKDYDRAIEMLTMSVEDTVVLSESDFQCYVQDEWRWKESWTTSNKLYTPESFPDDDDVEANG